MEDIVDLKGRNALVTGAGQGVGKAIALRLARHNAGTVIVNDYYEDRAKLVVEEIKSLGFKAVAAQGDVSKLDDFKRIAAEASRSVGAIEVLVNNAGNMGPAGVVVGKPFWEQEPEEWDLSIRVNFYGVLNAVRAILPGMIAARSGSIVTIVSDAGRVGEPRLEAYSGAKAGAAGFMRAIAKSAGRFNVRANCIALSATKTPTIRVDETSEIGKKMLQPYIIRRFGEPDDAARMVVFLASDASSWVTGQTYPVNGGYALAV
jgi:2-hydroxycyclohexanecarboxyl-CoA dehydrogenase